MSTSTYRNVFDLFDKSKLIDRCSVRSLSVVNVDSTDQDEESNTFTFNEKIREKSFPDASGRTIRLYEIILLPNHLEFLNLYSSNMNMPSEQMGEYSKAFIHCEKALKSPEESFSSNHLDLVATFNNINIVCKIS